LWTAVAIHADSPAEPDCGVIRSTDQMEWREKSMSRPDDFLENHAFLLVQRIRDGIRRDTMRLRIR